MYDVHAAYGSAALQGLTVFSSYTRRTTKGYQSLESIDTPSSSQVSTSKTYEETLVSSTGGTTAHQNYSYGWSNSRTTTYHSSYGYGDSSYTENSSYDIPPSSYDFQVGPGEIVNLLYTSLSDNYRQVNSNARVPGTAPPVVGEATAYLGQGVAIGELKERTTAAPTPVWTPDYGTPTRVTTPLIDGNPNLTTLEYVTKRDASPDDYLVYRGGGGIELTGNAGQIFFSVPPEPLPTKPPQLPAGNNIVSRAEGIVVDGMAKEQILKPRGQIPQVPIDRHLPKKGIVKGYVDGGPGKLNRLTEVGPGTNSGGKTKEGQLDSIKAPKVPKTAVFYKPEGTVKPGQTYPLYELSEAKLKKINDAAANGKWSNATRWNEIVKAGKYIGNITAGEIEAASFESIKAKMIEGTKASMAAKVGSVYNMANGTLIAVSLVTNEVGRTIENAPVTGYAGQTVVGGTYSYSDDCGKFTILQEPVLAGLFGSNYYKLYRDSAGNIVSKVSITSAEMKKIEAARKAKEGYFEFNVWSWEWEWKMGTDGTSPPTVLNPLTSA